MQVAITGGAGFIGSNLCKSLLARGHTVRVLDDLSTGYLRNLDALAVDFTQGSIEDAALVAEWCKGSSAVVHLAARGSVPRSLAEPIRTDEVNVRGSLNVYEAAREHGAHVIVASSSSVYGANTASPKIETLQPRPMSPYAASKLACESYALSWGSSYGTDVLVFRFFNVYGPGQAAGHAYAAVVPRFVHAALSGEKAEIYGDGQQSRDFTFVGSVCSAIVDALERRLVYAEPVNLAFGANQSVLELRSLIEEVAGAPVRYRFAEPRTGDVRHSQADPTRFRSLFPDVVAVDLRQGIEETVRWMRSGRDGA
jgi:UDP-glucose 4-epimerase